MLLVALMLVVHGTTRASTYAAKTDNEVVALDLRTGKELWSYKPKHLSDAHFEAHAAGLIVYPHYAGNKRSNAIYLDYRNGKRLRAFSSRRQPLAKSATFWPLPKLALRNGWVLRGFRPGYSKQLRFVDPRTNKTTWVLRTPGYPYRVAAWRNLVFWAYGYLSHDGILRAHRAGRAKPVWTVDLNRLLPPGPRPRFHGRIRAYPLTRMIFQVIDNTLYVNANEHVFALDPATGRLRWHRNLAADLGLKYFPDFFGGALNLAVFAKSHDVLVVAFERRVVAIDLARHKYLWHLRPDTFPHCPFPIIYNGRVFVTAGAKHTLVRVP